MEKIINYIKKDGWEITVIEIALILLGIRFNALIGIIPISFLAMLFSPKHFEHFSGNHEDYPKVDLISDFPKWIGKLIEPYYYDYKGGIPKEVVRIVYLEIGVLIASAMALEVIFFLSHQMLFPILLISIAISVVVDFALIAVFDIKKFLNIYIRVNRENIKCFFFRWMPAPVKEMGSCEVIGQYKVQKRLVLDVKLKKDNTIVKKVEIPKEILQKQDFSGIYYLYERCNMRYIAEKDDFRLRFR